MVPDRGPVDRGLAGRSPRRSSLNFLAAYEAACQSNEGGAFLRREGLYSSQMTEWRRLRDAGVLAGKKAGESIGKLSTDQAENARLRRQLEVSESRLKKTEAALELTWDITKLAGPVKGKYFGCYMMVDIHSRFIVGAHVHATESGVLAVEMMRGIFGIHGIPQVVHADRGTSMTSKTVASLLSDLEVTRSHSRPRVLVELLNLVPVMTSSGRDIRTAPGPKPLAWQTAGIDSKFKAGATVASALLGGLAMMYWDGNMGGWGYVLMVISFVVFWGAVIAAVVLLARATGAGGRGRDLTSGAGYAENVLAERFARGEIDEVEYTARLDVLRRGGRK